MKTIAQESITFSFFTYNSPHTPASYKRLSWSQSRDQQDKTSALEFVRDIRSRDYSHRDGVRRQRSRLDSHSRRHQSCCL